MNHLGSAKERRKGMIPSKTVFIPFFFCIIALCGSFLSTPAFASESEKGQTDAFAKDGVNLQLVTGSLFSSHIFANGVKVTNAWQTDLRLGWIFTKPLLNESLFRGNFQAIFEIANAWIYKGPGNYYGGITALLRYNFVQPGAKLIPYAQIGAGVIYNDAYKDETQNAIGQAFEFTPQAGIGLHYLLKENWSIDFEGVYHHISNAGLARRNVGLNSFGGLIGVTYFFDQTRK